MPARNPEETHALLAEAFNAGDLDAAVELYEENATLIPPGGNPASGKEAIRGALEPFLALRPRIQIEVAKKFQCDGLAMTYSRWTLVGTDPEGNKVEMGGRGAEVSRQQADGSWLIAIDDPMGDD